MKNILTIGAAFIFTTGAITTAIAATKCVRLSSTTRCTISTTYKNRATWAATCGGVPITGTAICASSGSYTIGAATSSIATSNTASNNKYCKCQITSPVVSRWITPGMCSDYACHTSLTADECSQYCGYMCATTIAGQNNSQVYPAFMSAIFSNFSD